MNIMNKKGFSIIIVSALVVLFGYGLVVHALIVDVDPLDFEAIADQYSHVTPDVCVNIIALGQLSPDVYYEELCQFKLARCEVIHAPIEPDELEDSIWCSAYDLALYETMQREYTHDAVTRFVREHVGVADVVGETYTAEQIRCFESRRGERQLDVLEAVSCLGYLQQNPDVAQYAPQPSFAFCYDWAVGAHQLRSESTRLACELMFEIERTRGAYTSTQNVCASLSDTPESHDLTIACDLVGPYYGFDTEGGGTPFGLSAALQQVLGASGGQNVGEALLPDFVVTNVEFDSATQSQTIVIANNGKETEGAPLIRSGWVFGNTIFSNQQHFVSAYPIQTSDNEYEMTISSLFDQYPPAGSVAYSVHVDSDDQIGELNEDNNRWYGAPFPDYHVSYVDVAHEDTVTVISIGVINGEDVAADPPEVEVSWVDADGAHIGRSIRTRPFEQASGMSWSVDLSVGDVPSDATAVRVVVDPDSDVRESNELNNERTRDLYSVDGDNVELDLSDEAVRADVTAFLDSLDADADVAIKPGSALYRVKLFFRSARRGIYWGSWEKQQIEKDMSQSIADVISVLDSDNARRIGFAAYTDLLKMFGAQQKTKANSRLLTQQFVFMSLLDSFLEEAQIEQGNTLLRGVLDMQPDFEPVPLAVYKDAPRLAQHALSAAQRFVSAEEDEIDGKETRPVHLNAIDYIETKISVETGTDQLFTIVRGSEAKAEASEPDEPSQEVLPSTPAPSPPILLPPVVVPPVITPSVSDEVVKSDEVSKEESIKETPEIEAKFIFCPNDKIPVCGADGVTYTNSCFARSADVEVEYAYACRSESECLAQGVAQVCAYSGKTYDNQCLLERANEAFRKKGPC
jgi:hypothetical protein